MEKKEKINILLIVASVILIFLIGLFVLIKPLFINNKNDSKIKPSESAYSVEDIKRAKKITSEDLREKILTENNIVIIDIRDKNSFKQEHIPDSINIYYPEIQQALAGLDKSKAYILVDDGSSFQAAFAAGGVFDANNFSDVFYLSGGFVAWKNKMNLTVSMGNPTSFVDQSKINYINSDDLKKIIETENNIYIIDVREKKQFEAGHIKNANSIFLDDLEKERKMIPRSKKIILYDENGFTAFQAGVRLYDLGFFNAFVLSDGLKVWKEKSYEIVK